MANISSHSSLDSLLKRFKAWMIGTPEQFEHEKKAWGRIGGAVLLGLALLVGRYLFGHH